MPLLDDYSSIAGILLKHRNAAPALERKWASSKVHLTSGMPISLAVAGSGSELLLLLLVSG
jgi:hypothetical protein